MTTTKPRHPLARTKLAGAPRKTSRFGGVRSGSQALAGAAGY